MRAACAANSDGSVAVRAPAQQLLRGGVEALEDGGALVGVEDRKAAERPRRVRDRSRQQPDQALAQRLDGAALEQVAPVVEPQLQRLARLHDQRQRIVRRVAAFDLAELSPFACCASALRSTG